MAALLLFAVALLLTASSCGGDKQEQLLVFVASSLTDVMERLGQRFGEDEGIRVVYNVGGSTALAQQIIRGAPADVFISAGSHPMDRLEERGLLMPDTRVELLTNELVLIAAPGVAEKMGIASVEDLVSSRARVAIADPDLAPAGEYAKEGLQNLGLWRQLKPRLVFGLDVRVALGYVETGNVDAGIVYRTDTNINEALEVIASLPAGSYSPIIYPAGVVESSGHTEAARKFLLFLEARQARETFREYGFVPKITD